MLFHSALLTYFPVYFKNYHTAFYINVYFLSPLIILNPTTCNKSMFQTVFWEIKVVIGKNEANGDSHLTDFGDYFENFHTA